MKKIFRKIHLYLSIPIGLIVSLICITGAILVFETEISEACKGSRYFVKEVKGKPLALNEIFGKVQKEVPDSMSIINVQVSSDPQKTYRIGLSGQNRNYIYVDPYTAEVVDENYNSQNNFFSKTRLLHRWLLLQGDSRTIGKRIVGITTLIFVIILITGIVVWIPKNKGQLKKRLKIRINKGWRKFWYDFHQAMGIYAAIVLLVLSLTGLTWSFEWYRNGFYGIFGVEAPKGGGHARVPQTASKENGVTQHRDRKKSLQDREVQRLNDSIENSDTILVKNADIQGSEKFRGVEKGLSSKNGNHVERDVKVIDFTVWQDVLSRVKKQQSSDYKYITLQDGSASVSLSALGNSRATDNYTFNVKTGDITETNLYSDREKSGKLRGWIYSVHTGSWGGIATKILTFIASFIGGILPLSGYYLYLKRTIKKKKAKLI